MGETSLENVARPISIRGLRRIPQHFRKIITPWVRERESRRLTRLTEQNRRNWESERVGPPTLDAHFVRSSGALTRGHPSPGLPSEAASAASDQRRMAERVGFFDAVFENTNECACSQRNARHINVLASPDFFRRSRPFAGFRRFCQRDGTRYGTRRDGF